MKTIRLHEKLFLLTVKTLLICLLFLPRNAQAQLSGTLSIPGNYFSLSAAITDLNTQGVGTGGVTINIAAGYTETITATLSLTATGTASAPIVFQKDPATTGANPLITAYTGGTGTPGTAVIDGIWQLVGSDYVTINGIDLQENASNTANPATMEFGYALFKSSVTNGCQNDTIKNCTITLNRINNATASGPLYAGSNGIIVVNSIPTAATTALTPTATTGSNSNNKFYSNTIKNCNVGISLSGFAAPSPYILGDQSNDIGGSAASTGNTILNFGGAASAANPAAGIYIKDQWGFNISYNTLNNNNGSGANHVTTLRGIYTNGSTGASGNINNNTLTILGGGTTAQISVIENAAGGSGTSINMNFNTIQNCSNATNTSGAWYGIWNSASTATLNMNNNTFTNNVSNATSASIYMIYNSGAVSATMNMNNNSLGYSLIGTAYSGTIYSVYHSAGGATTTASMNNNNFAGYNFTATSTGSIYFIYNTVSNLNLNINNNTWTALNLNHSSSEYLIYNSSSTQNALVVNNNSIVTSYTRTAGCASLYCYYAGASSLPTSTQTFSGNNFSNITGTVAGSGTFYGIYTSDGATSPYPRKTFVNNTFSNINYNNSSTSYIMYMSYLGDGSGTSGSTIYNNTISNVSLGASSLYGFYPTATASPTYATNIYNNTLTGLTTTNATGSVYGYYLGATTPGSNVYRNKCSNVQSTTTSSGAAYGMYAYSSAPYTIYNNIVGDIKASTATNNNAVNGIYISSGTTVNLYYNTVVLSGTSSGSGFGSSGIYASTSPTVLLQNNIVINNCVATGSGKTVAYRRSSSLINTYASSSNNNIWYAGSTPTSANPVYYDGTNLDSTFIQFKARVTPRDVGSATENTTFISTTGSSPNYLQPDSTVGTRLESGGVNVAGITTDFNGRIRQGNTGYTGTGGNPDIGAFEGENTGIGMLYDSSNVDQVSLSVLRNSTNQPVLRIKVYTENSNNPISVTRFKLNTSGTTSLADISNAKIFYTGNNPVFSATNQFGSTVAAPNGTFYINGSRTVSTGTCYFWLTYDLPATATYNNTIDGRLDSIVIGGVNQAPVNGDPAGGRNIAPPMSGSYTVATGQPYTTLDAIITDLNARGISSNVTVNLPAGFTETAPVNGYALGSTILNASLSGTTTLTFRKSGAGVNPLLTAPVGTGINDGIFTIQGADYVTIDGIDLVESAANTTTNAQMEWGYGLLKLNATAPFDGCQRDTIKNSTITLNRTNAASRGIYANNHVLNDITQLNITAATDANNYNVFINDTVQNVNSGIYISGFAASSPYNLFDQGNIVGGAAGTGNVIVNFAGASSGYGIYLFNQSYPVISYNNVDNYNGGAAGAIGSNSTTYGIVNTYTNTSQGNPAHLTANNNSVLITMASGSSSSIYDTYFYYGFGNQNVNNNTLKWATLGTCSGTFYGLYMYTPTYYINGSTLNVKNNNLSNVTVANSSGSFYPMYIYGDAPTMDISGNQVTNLTRTAGSSGVMYLMYTYGSSTYNVAGTVKNIYNNTISGIDNGTSTGSIYGYYYISGGYTTNVYNNTLSNVTASTVGTGTMYCYHPYYYATNYNFYNNTASNITYGGTTLYGIYHYGYYFANSNVYNNRIYGLTGSATTTTMAGMYAYYTATNSFNAYGNKFYSLNATGTSTCSVQGIYILQSTYQAISNVPVNLYNNLMSDFNAPSSTASPCITGMTFSYSSYTYTAGVYFNTILLNGNGGANYNSAGIYVASQTPTVKLANNIIIDNTTHSGTGIASGYWRAGSSLATYDNTSNNNLFYAGTPSATRVIYYDGTNKDQTIAAFRARMSPRDASSVTENTTFISTSPASPNYLVIDSTVATVTESGGMAITGITTDFNGNVRQGNTGYAGTGSAPDLGAYEGNDILNDLLPPVFTLTPLTNTAATGDRTVVVTISDRTATSVSTYPPTMYYKKFMNGSWNSTQGGLVSGNAQNGTWNFTISASFLGSVSLGDSVYYYIVAQDSSVNNNIGSTPGGVNALSVYSVTTPPSTLYSYKIVPGINGVITVGTGGNYPSLTTAGGAFEAINASALTGNVTLKIISDLAEDGVNGLNQWSEGGSGNYTLTIVPDSAVERTIVGNVSAAGSGLIRFNGADRIKVDGRYQGTGTGRYLRFRNRAAAGTTFILQNDAHRDTIMYITAEGINNTTGTILFGNSNVVGGSGNDSNAVMYCVISDTLGTTTGNVQNTGFSSSGTPGLENSENALIGNNVKNYGYNGINLNNAGTGNNWIITDNTFYQDNGPRTTQPQVILIQGGSGHRIQRNSIGGAAPNRSGNSYTTNSASFYGIYINGSNTLPTIVDSNIISNVTVGVNSSSYPIYAIYVAAGNVSVTNNIIGGLVNPYDSIVSGYAAYGVYVGVSGSSSVLIDKNNISYISYTAAATVARTYGVYVAGGPTTITNNVIHDLTQNCLGASPFANGYLATGIYISTSTGSHLIEKNTIYNIYGPNGSGAGAITYASGSAPVTVQRNRIYNIACGNISSTGIANAIYNNGSGTNLYANNQISMGANSSDRVIGIQDVATSGNNNYYYNSVFVDGSSASAVTGSSYCFQRTSNTTNDVRNNIFFMSRTNLGSSSSYAAGSSLSSATLMQAINYNLMVVPDTAKLVEHPLNTANGVAAWNAAYAPSYNSNWMEATSAISAASLFTNTAAGNLGIVTTNNTSWYANGKGIAIAGMSGDYSNASGVRSVTIAAGATDLGASEFSTSTLPISATASGAPALNTTTSYTFAGRKVAAFTWGAAGTVPASVDVKYYTGVTAPSLLASKTQFNAYYAVTPTGGSGYTYKLSLSCDTATFGNVASMAAAKPAYYKSVWNLVSAGNASAGMLNTNNSLAATTLPANFTGTDNSNPLPVSWLQVDARTDSKDVLLTWSTASELNNREFTIERSADGSDFSDAGVVAGAGNSNMTRNYQFVDAAAFDHAGVNTLYYRIRQTDMDGAVTYSAVVSVNRKTPHTAITVFPNPFSDVLHISFFTKDATPAQVTISDLQGRVLSSGSYETASGWQDITIPALDNLQGGVYFVRVIQHDQAQTFKLLKQ